VSPVRAVRRGPRHAKPRTRAQRAAAAAVLCFAATIQGCGSHRTIASVTAAPTAAASVCVPTIRSENGRLDFELAVVSTGPSGAPAFSYDGVVGVAPTLRVFPGQ
jgi:hypothetical protein